MISIDTLWFQFEVAETEFELEEQLQLLQRGDRIRRISADLVPTEESGVARLLLEVEEEDPFKASLELNNHLNPAIGAAGAWLRLSHQDLTGRRDSLDSLVRFSEGLR